MASDEIADELTLPTDIQQYQHHQKTLDFVYTNAYIHNMRFEWDENKNRSNISKHGIDFEQAKKIFEDPNLLTYEDARFSYGEIREISIGQLLLTTQQKIIIALVVYTDRNGIIRLISARKASKQERKEYEQQSI